MTHQEKLTKVTEAIHKACPDLLELKFVYDVEDVKVNGEDRPSGIVPKDLRDKFLQLMRCWEFDKLLNDQSEEAVSLLYSIFYP